MTTEVVIQRAASSLHLGVEEFCGLKEQSKSSFRFLSVRTPYEGYTSTTSSAELGFLLDVVHGSCLAALDTFHDSPLGYILQQYFRSKNEKSKEIII